MPRKNYTSSAIDVSFDGEVCMHAAECVRGMPEVFDTSKRPWLNPGNAATLEAVDHLVEVVGRCPSGALKVERVDKGVTSSGR